MRKPTDEEFVIFLKKIGKYTTNTLGKKWVIITITLGLLLGTILSYSWSYKAIAGFFDQSEWGVHGVLTNWTIGFAMFWVGVGACLGLLLKKWNVPSRYRAFIIALIMFLCAYLFSMIGFEGFRWGQ